MGRVPGHQVPGIDRPDTVVMPHDGGAFTAARPIAASRVAASGGMHAHGIGTCQDIMLVGLFTATLDPLTVFVEAGLDVDLDKTQSNYIVAMLDVERMTAGAFVQYLGEHGVLATASGEHIVRFVVSKQVNREDIVEALAIAQKIWREHVEKR